MQRSLWWQGSVHSIFDPTGSYQMLDVLNEVRSPSLTATTPYFCHGVFTDRSILGLNLSRFQIPTGTSLTNCNHKHGLLLTCRHVHVRPHCFILTGACLCRLELGYFARKISKNRLVCKNAVALAYYGSCRLLMKYCFSFGQTVMDKEV